MKDAELKKKESLNMKRDAIVIKNGDNVATALAVLKREKPATVGVEDEIVTIALISDIEFGHKFAITDILRGQDIIKYGEVIGRATEDIPVGTHAHIHNVESLRGRGDLDQ